MSRMPQDDRIFARGVQPEVPRASSITLKNIHKAYLDKDRRQQRRIEKFGKINRDTLRQLGAEIKRVVR